MGILTAEEQVKSLDMYKAIYGNDECAVKFFDQMKDNAKIVQVVSYKSIPELKELVDKHIQRHEKVPKQCYENAAETVLAIEGVEYVEGILSSYGLPISHGWNVYKGQYFDLTLELNGRLKEEDVYVEMMKVDQTTLRRLCIKLGQWGPFSACHYTGKKVIIPYGI
jgi:hypothetical protein